MRVYVKGINAYYRAEEASPQALDHPRRDRAERDQERALRRGRRRRGGRRRVPRRPSGLARRGQGLLGLERPAPAPRPGDAGVDPRALPVRAPAREPDAATSCSTTAPTCRCRRRGPAASAAVDGEFRRQASNVLMVAGKRSRSGHPLFVGGPQIGHFYPGLTLEMDLQGPGWKARGATSAPFPGYILIGRREDFVWTLTSAGADIIDIYVETLCGGSDTKYLFRGQCRDMSHVQRRHARRPAGELQPDGARPGGGLRDGRRPARGDLAQALELPARRRGRADLPAPHARARAERARVHQGGGDLSADVQHVLRGRQPGREHHDRPAAAAGAGRGLRACRRTAPATSSGAGSTAPGPTRRRSRTAA